MVMNAFMNVYCRGWHRFISGFLSS